MAFAFLFQAECASQSKPATNKPSQSKDSAIGRPDATASIIAEGTYESHPDDKSVPVKKVDHWILRRYADGSTEVEITMQLGGHEESGSQKPSPYKQFMRFTANKRWSQYRLEMPGHDGGEAINLSCDLGVEILSCEGKLGGKPYHGKQAVTSPYGFMPGEFYGLDFPWFWMALANLMREDQTELSLPVMIMDDGDTPDTLKFEPDTENQVIESHGKETIEVLGHEVSARKLEMRGMGTLWLSSSGVLLQARTEGGTMILVDFKQSGDLVPELK